MLLGPLIVILLLVGLNGLFVAAEFAIIGVRASRLEELASRGNQPARQVHRIVRNAAELDRYFAVAQLGITLASLGLGMYGEPVIAHWLEARLEGTPLGEEAIIHTLSFIVALSIVTYLHVVLGEMVPKSLALQRSESIALLLLRPMNVFGRIFSVPITILNWIGLQILLAMRISPSKELRRLYTSEELELIISDSYRGGMLGAREQELVGRVFDFSERRVSQVMTPRTSIEAIPVDIGESDLLDLVASLPYSRIPVYEGNLDDIVGVLHVKDFVRQQLTGRGFDLLGVLRPAYFVPESAHIDGLLASFRKRRSHLAVVIDEHGGTLGLVTLEDLIEEVLGEVQDEFDTGEDAPLYLVSPGLLFAQGTVLLETLAEYVDLGERSEDVQTIGGLALSRLRLPPEVGDEFHLGEAKVRVEAVDGMAVRRVSIRYPAPHTDKL